MTKETRGNGNHMTSSASEMQIQLTNCCTDCWKSKQESVSVDLLNSWASAAATATSGTHVWHATSTHVRCTTSCLVNLHHDGVHHALQLLLLGLELILLGQLVLVEPIQSLLDCLLDVVLVITLELVLELLFLQGVAHGEAIILEAILGLDLCLVGFILLLVLL